VTWDPQQYAVYEEERSRPFHELVDRIGATAPRRVVDLGCGQGTLTQALLQRWPTAWVEGIDSSPEMIASAAVGTGVDLRVADIADWAPSDDTDVVVSNAALQWVPGHPDLLRRWAKAVPEDGWLAWQVPGNFGSPSHRLMRELAESPRWARRLGGVLRHSDAVLEPDRYAQLLVDEGMSADVWESTYQHVLVGQDPVLEWVRGTALRPLLAVLVPTDAARFERDYAAALRSAYPAVDGTTLFAFRRIFCVGHKP
jgi:trans-aconitate 2-methyltransferase